MLKHTVSSPIMKGPPKTIAWALRPHTQALPGLQQSSARLPHHTPNQQSTMKMISYRSKSQLRTQLQWTLDTTNPLYNEPLDTTNLRDGHHPEKFKRNRVLYNASLDTMNHLLGYKRVRCTPQSSLPSNAARGETKRIIMIYTWQISGSVWKLTGFNHWYAWTDMRWFQMWYNK